MCPISVFWGSWWASQCCGHRKEDISNALLCSLKILYWAAVLPRGCAQATWMGKWCQMSLSCLIQEGMNWKRKCFPLMCFPGSSSGASSAEGLLWPLSCSRLWQGCWFPVDSQPEPCLKWWYGSGWDWAKEHRESGGPFVTHLVVGQPPWPLWMKVSSSAVHRRLLPWELSAGWCSSWEKALWDPLLSFHELGEDCAAEAGASKKVATSPSPLFLYFELFIFTLFFFYLLGSAP